MKLKPPARVTAIAAGGDHSMAVTVAGALLAFGSNKHGQVRSPGGRERAAAGVGNRTSAARTCCSLPPADLTHRPAPALPLPTLQLGTGDTLDRMVPTEVPLALDSEAGQLVRAMQVQCGAQHTLVLVQTRGASQVRSAGGNSYGELGLGDRVERHRFHPIPALLVRGRWGWGPACTLRQDGPKETALQSAALPAGLLPTPLPQQADPASPSAPPSHRASSLCA